MQMNGNNLITHCLGHYLPVRSVILFLLLPGQRLSFNTTCFDRKNIYYLVEKSDRNLDVKADSGEGSDTS